jgi:preprotein translocase subunit SecG
MFVIFSVFYILIAAAMIVLILLQNGAGADAGSGFGSGASATVFGARGSATFLTRATGVLASLFFLLSISMGIYLHSKGQVHDSGAGLGVMAGVAQPAAPKVVPPTTTGSEVPSSAATTAPGSTLPVAPAAVQSGSHGEVPAAPAAPVKKH